MDVMENALSEPVAVAGEIGGGRLSAFIQRVDSDFSAIKGPVLLFIILEMVDGFLTMWATNNGFVETNHLVAGYSQSWLYPALKLLTVLLGAIALLPAVKRFPGHVRTGFIAASVFMAAVLLSNLYAMGVS